MEYDKELDDKYNENVKKIHILSIKTEEFKNSIKHLEIDTSKKNHEIENLILEQEILEKERKKKVSELLVLHSIKSGAGNLIPDFELNINDIMEDIPLTPIHGINEIKTQLENLKEIFAENQHLGDTSKDGEEKSIVVKYLGESLKYIVPDDYNYTFKNLVDDISDFFEVKASDMVLKDELNNIWPSNFSVKEILHLKKKQVSLFLALKKNKTDIKVDESSKIYEGDDIMYKTLKEIDTLLLNQENKENNSNIIVEEEIQEYNKTSTTHFDKQNATILEIEKTFGQVFINLFFYLIFIGIILYFNNNKNDDSIFILNRSINREFYTKQIPINFTLYDFLTEENSNQYSSSMNFNEMGDATLIFEWMKYNYFENLGFYTGNFKLFNRFTIIGPVRLTQLRQDSTKKDECKIYSSSSDSDHLYCYGEYTKSQKTQSHFYKFNNITNPDDLKYVKECNDVNTKYNRSQTNNNTINFTETDKHVYLGCKVLNGFNYQDNPFPYTFKGVLNSYNLNGGFVIEFPTDSVYHFEELSIAIDFISRYWVDISSRLLVLSFNIIDPDNSKNQILTVNLYIEIGSTNVINKVCEVNRFSLFINLIPLLSIEKFTLDSLIKFISDNILEILYVLLLFFYSLINLVSDIKIIKKERNIFNLKGINQFFMGFATRLLIMGIFVFRFIYLTYQIILFKQFLANNFTEFFPVSYLDKNFNYLLNIIELIMIVFITVNVFNMIYIEFFGQIFTTFQHSIKNLLSFFFVYVILIMSFSTSCSILFGLSIKRFSDFFRAFNTMILFVFQDADLLIRMFNLNSFIARFIITAYLILIRFAFINIIYMIFYESFVKIKKAKNHSLLKYSVISYGLKYFAQNEYLKIWKIFKRLLKKVHINLE